MPNLLFIKISFMSSLKLLVSNGMLHDKNSEILVGKEAFIESFFLDRKRQYRLYLINHLNFLYLLIQLKNIH